VLDMVILQRVAGVRRARRRMCAAIDPRALGYQRRCGARLLLSPGPGLAMIRTQAP
jgi:hypothetical protein